MTFREKYERMVDRVEEENHPLSQNKQWMREALKNRERIEELEKETEALSNQMIKQKALMKTFEDSCCELGVIEKVYDLVDSKLKGSRKPSSIIGNRGKNQQNSPRKEILGSKDCRIYGGGSGENRFAYGSDNHFCYVSEYETARSNQMPPDPSIHGGKGANHTFAYGSEDFFRNAGFQSTHEGQMTKTNGYCNKLNREENKFHDQLDIFGNSKAMVSVSSRSTGKQQGDRSDALDIFLNTKKATPHWNGISQVKAYNRIPTDLKTEAYFKNTIRSRK